MTYEQYAKIPALNATSLKAGQLSMLHMRQAMMGVSKKATPAMVWGKLIHLAILEPERFKQSVVAWDGIKRGREYDKFKEEFADSEIVSPADLDDLQAIQKAVNDNKDAVELLRDCEGWFEKTVQWTDDSFGACKARLDGQSKKRGVLELKSAARIDNQAFIKQFVNLGYDIQCGWYARGGEVDKVTILAVESDAPHDVAVYEVPKLAIKVGYRKACKIANEYRKCEACGVFPGVSEGVGELVLPDWYGEDEIMDGFFNIAKEQLGMGEEL
jgi:hypothetical protein